MLRSFTRAGFILSILLAAPITANAQLEVASWGGLYQSTQQIAFVAPFNQQLAGGNIDPSRIRMVEHNGSIEDLLNGDPPWYLIDLEAPEINDGCDKELLLPISLKEVNTDSKRIDSTNLRCGVASLGWSQLVAVNKSGLSAFGEPLTLGDFFATDLFPGRRALPRRPQGLLEFALLSTGTKPSTVYEQLATETGIDTALGRLTDLKRETIWFESAAEGLAILRQNRANLALIYHSQILPLARSNPDKYGMIFDGQLLEYGYWAIPASTPSEKESLRLLTAALSDDVLARSAQVSGYGPSATGAFEALSPALAKLLPTNAANLKTAFSYDANWWRSTAGAEAIKAFEAWFDSSNN